MSNAQTHSSTNSSVTWVHAGRHLYAAKSGSAGDRGCQVIENGGSCWQALKLEVTRTQLLRVSLLHFIQFICIFLASRSLFPQHTEAAACTGFWFPHYGVFAQWMARSLQTHSLLHSPSLCIIPTWRSCHVMQWVMSLACKLRRIHQSDSAQQQASWCPPLAGLVSLTRCCLRFRAPIPPIKVEGWT